MNGRAKRFATGAGWIYGYRWLDRLLDFLALAVLARLLVPEDFGLVAIAASIVTIVQGLSDFDVGRALIHIRDDQPDLYDSAWTLSALRGVASALLIAVVGALLDDPQIAGILYALALSPLLVGLSSPRFIRYERGLVYSRLAALTLGAKVVSISVTIAIALAYRSYWALVIGMLGGNLASLLLSYILSPYRPRLSLARFRDIFSFSGWMSLTTMVTALSMETDKIIVGRLIGIANTGRYFMIQRVGVLPTRELIAPLQRILYPSFSEIAQDAPRLRRVVVESINVLGSLSLPAACGFALIANDFVPLVLGDKWSSIVPYLRILVPFLGLRATLSMTLPCVMALGHTRLLFLVSLVYALVHLPAFIAGTALYGMDGAIWSIVLAGIFYSYLNAWMLQRTLGIALAEVLVQLRRPLGAAALMVAAVLAVGALPGLELFAADGSWVALIAKALVGAAVYCGAQYALWRIEGRPPGIERRLLQLLSR